MSIVSLRLVQSRKAVLVSGLGMVAFGVSFLAARNDLVRLPDVSVVWPAGKAAYIPSGTWGEKQLFLVYVGSAGCWWSNAEWMPSVLDSIKTVLRDRAATIGMSFATLGVALDWAPEDGMSHLRKMGPFDEIAAGYSWMNSSALRYLWNDIPGEAATPQIVLVYRNVQVPERGRGPRGFTLQQETLLNRVVGAFEIRRWLHNGVPVRGDLPVP